MTHCLAPTSERPFDSINRLVCLGTLTGIVMGGVVFPMLISAVEVIDDPGDVWAPSLSITLFGLIFTCIVGAVFGAIVGLVGGLVVAGIGKVSVGSRLAMALSAFVVAFAPSYGLMLAYTGGRQTQALVAACLVAAVTAWVMTAERIGPRRRLRR